MSIIYGKVADNVRFARAVEVLGSEDMLKYLVKRIFFTLITFFIISVLLFLIIKSMPGDPVKNMLPLNLKGAAYESAYNAMRIKMGLDKPLPVQYIRWVGRMFQGDYGYSTTYNRPVADAIKEPLANTVSLNLFSTVITLAIALPIGIRCATKRLSLFDNSWQVFSLITYSMPSFFIGLCLIFIFGIWLKILPIGGMPNRTLLSGIEYILAWFKHALLPALLLALTGLAALIRYVRNAMIDSLSQDYIRTARAKGLSERVVVYSHAFRNALIPISTVVISYVFSIFAGAPITETVFAWHGIGYVLTAALTERDNMMAITAVWISVVFMVIGNLVADIVYGLVDPRIRLE